MSLGKRFYYSMTTLFADVTALYCTYMFVSVAVGDRMMYFDIIALMLLAAVAALVNCILARRELSMLMFLGINAAVAAVTITAMFLLPHDISGIGFYLAAAVLFAYPAARAAYIIRNPVTAVSMLVYSEMSVIGTGFLFITQIGSFQPGMTANILCVAAMLLNIVALSSLRMEHAMRARSKTSGLKRGLILAVVVAALLAAAILLGLVLPATKDVVIAVLTVVERAASAVLDMIWRFLLFIASLFPAPEDVPVDIDEQYQFEMPKIREMAEVNTPRWLVIAFVVVLAGGAAALVLLLLNKLRKMRLHTLRLESVVLREKSTAPSLAAVLHGLLQKIGSKIERYRLLVRNYDNCAGVFIRIERRGRLCGLPRTDSQTPREYLYSLAARLQEDDPARAVFAELAGQIDLWCFSSCEKRPQRISKGKISLLKCAVKRMRGKPGAFLRAHTGRFKQTAGAHNA